MIKVKDLEFDSLEELSQWAWNQFKITLEVSDELSAQEELDEIIKELEEIIEKEGVSCE